jgi:thioredoxin 1
MVITVEKAEDFKAKIKTGKVIVDFYADWCGPCKMQGPVLDQFAKEKPDALVLKVNVDKHTDLAEEYGIMSIPTMLVIDQGKVTYKQPGFHPLPKLLSLIK